MPFWRFPSQSRRMNNISLNNINENLVGGNLAMAIMKNNNTPRKQTKSSVSTNYKVDGRKVHIGRNGGVFINKNGRKRYL